MRMIAALILSGLLAVLAYGIFWLVCLNYTTGQLREAVADGLGGEIAYARPEWVPDYSQVTMLLPVMKLKIAQGPVREMEAANVLISSGFLLRDRWRMAVPGRVNMVLANGRKLVLETEKGEIIWRKKEGSLTWRADKLRVTDENGLEVAAFDDVMLERKPSDHGVRVNLASRPKLHGEQGILSGEVVLPPAAFGKVVDLFGGATPDLGDILRTIVTSLQKGGGGANTVKMENVSFKFPSAGSGAISGDMTVMADGKVTGKMSLTADSRDRVMAWVQKAGVAKPRTEVENAGVVRFFRGMPKTYPAVTMENMQTTLTLNGNPVGALPTALDVVSRMWP